MHFCLWLVVTVTKWILVTEFLVEFDWSVDEGNDLSIRLKNSRFGKNINVSVFF